MTESFQPVTAATLSAGPRQQGVRIGYYLRRHWWFPLFTGVLAGALTGGYAVHRTIVHTAVARMWVGGTLRIPEGSYFTEELQNLFGTQTELMKSVKIRRRALERLGSAHPLDLAADPPEVEVLQPRKTSLFLLSTSGPNPEFVVDYLDGVLEEYQAYRREVRAATSEDSLRSLRGELEKQDDELRQVEEHLVAFQATNNAVVLEQEGVSAGNYLARLQLEFSQLKLEYELLGAIVDSDNPLAGMSPSISVARGPALDLNRAGTSSTAWPGNSRDLDGARQYVELLKLQRAELGRDLRPKHPKMVRLDEEIGRSEALISVVQGQTMEQLRATRETLRRRVDNLETAVRSWEIRTLDLNARMAEFTRLKAEVNRAQRLRDRFVEVIRGLDLEKRLDQITVSVLDRATLLPGAPGWKRWGAAGAAAGVLAGLALLAAVAVRDDRLFSAQDLLVGFQLELLGEVPWVRGRKREPLEPVQPDDARFTFLEAFRALRSILLFQAPEDQRPKTVLITSAQPGEGKSTVALNLARTLAFAGSKVLLIDGDLRRGTLHERLGTPASPGLTEVVGGRVEGPRAVVADGLPDLSFMPAGQAAAGSGELFLHRRFDQLILDCAKAFDFILLDSAPVLATADTATLAPRVDAVILVVREKATRNRPLREAIELLTRRQSNLLGVVVNAVDGAPKGRRLFGDPAYREVPRSADPEARG